MYMETTINGKPLQGLLDTKVDMVSMAKELANEIGLSYNKGRGFVKRVNTRSLPIECVA